jgi:hypothetical protein
MPIGLRLTRLLLVAVCLAVIVVPGLLFAMSPQPQAIWDACATFAADIRALW